MAFLQPAEIHLDVYLSKCINMFKCIMYNTVIQIIPAKNASKTANYIENFDCIFASGHNKVDVKKPVLNVFMSNIHPTKHF